MQHKTQMKWKFLFVKYNPEREKKKNQWVHKTGTSETYFDESSSMESESKRQLDLGVEELKNINEQQTSSKHLH